MKKLVILFLVQIVQMLSGQKINTAFVYSVHPSDGKQQRPPVLIILHGYGSNENDLFELAGAFDPSFTTIALRAPRELGPGSYCWYDLQVNGGAKVYNYAQAVKSRAMVLSFISNACKTLQLDSNRVFVLGFSQGAIMAYDIALASEGKIAAIAPLSGRMMDETQKLPIKLEKLQNLHVFIAHGTSDNVLSYEESVKAKRFFEALPLKHISFHTYPIAHSISGQELNDLKLWLKSTLQDLQKTTAK